jgi:septal ring factor EnvC (AmiA/AmiB activator)
MRPAFFNTSLRAMKPITAATFLAAVLLLLTPAVAQTPTQKDADELNALIKDVQAQQVEIAENQTKIEEKIATLGETIREARIFSSRGGR